MNKLKKPEQTLWLALVLTASFTCVEGVAGLLSGSLGLIADAAHMSTDVAMLVISLFSIQISKKQADNKRTFGYYRFEIFAAVLNAVILFWVAAYIFYQAYKRLFVPHSIESTSMLVIASIGLLVNFITIRLLQTNDPQGLCVRGAYLEAWADLLSSVSVIIAALIIHFTGWTKADSIIAIGIGLWILPRSWILLKESVNILLEGVPEGLELAAIHKTLMLIPGVMEVHDLHVWALTSGKVSLTAHIVIDPNTTHEQEILQTAVQKLEKTFSISHSTLQVEIQSCESGKLDSAQPFHFK